MEILTVAIGIERCLTFHRTEEEDVRLRWDRPSRVHPPWSQRRRLLRNTGGNMTRHASKHA